MSAPQTPEDDRRILAAAPQDSNDWDDETWGAWWRTAERVHGDAPRATATPGREQEIRARAEAASDREQLAGMYVAHVGESFDEILRLRENNRALRASENVLQQQIDAQAKEIDRLCADRDAAVAAAVRRALEDAAKRQREFVLSDDFVCDDWEAALTVVDLIDPAVAPAREQGEEAAR